MNNDMFYQKLMSLADGDPYALETLVGYTFLCPHKGLQTTLKSMQKYGIVGSKINKIFKDCCHRDTHKLIRTMQVISQNVYSREEIKANLESQKAMPFISEEVKLSIDEIYKLNKFDDEIWAEYAKLNAQIVKPKLQKIVAEKQTQRGEE